MCFSKVCQMTVLCCLYATLLKIEDIFFEFLNFLKLDLRVKNNPKILYIKKPVPYQDFKKYICLIWSRGGKQIRRLCIMVPLV